MRTVVDNHYLWWLTMLVVVAVSAYCGGQSLLWWVTMLVMVVGWNYNEKIMMQLRKRCQLIGASSFLEGNGGNLAVLG